MHGSCQNNDIWVRGKEVSNSVKDKCKCSSGRTSGTEGDVDVE